jgi:hypothetical protein
VERTKSPSGEQGSSEANPNAGSTLLGAVSMALLGTSAALSVWAVRQIVTVGSTDYCTTWLTAGSTTWAWASAWVSAAAGVVLAVVAYRARAGVLRYDTSRSVLQTCLVVDSVLFLVLLVSIGAAFMEPLARCP